jgi:ParB family chromosome partitioning protein
MDQSSENSDVHTEGCSQFCSADHFDLEEKKMQYQDKTVQYIQTDLLHPCENQPRRTFYQNSLEELAQSICHYGMLQPIIVFVSEQGRITIVAGERRWRAAKIAGLEYVPCLVQDVRNQNQFEIALIENIQREELSPFEEAQSLKKLIEEHHYTQETLAKKIGKSREAVSNLLRLLVLPQAILIDLHNKVITTGHARALCAFENEQLQIKAHSLVVKKKLSVRQTEDLIKSLKSNKSALNDSISPDLRYICDQFKGYLGTKVKITGDQNKGKIEISYYTFDDLERISDLILFRAENILP